MLFALISVSLLISGDKNMIDTMQVLNQCMLNEYMACMNVHALGDEEIKTNIVVISDKCWLDVSLWTKCL